LVQSPSHQRTIVAARLVYHNSAIQIERAYAEALVALQKLLKQSKSRNLLVPSESAPQELSNEWSGRYVPK
jgi:hypothetical protein